MSTTINHPQNKSIDEQTTKLSILKKAVIEERKKNQTLQDELLILKDLLSSKDEQIIKLRSENNSLSDSINKKDPKTYFDNMFKVPDTSSQTEIDDLKGEISKLNIKIKSLEKDNTFLKEHLDDCLITYQNLQAASTETIDSLKKEIRELTEKTVEDEGKKKVMLDYFKEYDIKKTNYEDTLSINERTIKKLTKDNEALAEQLNAYDKSVDYLKNRIEELTMTNYQLNEQLDKHVVYNRSHTFIGSIMRSSRKCDAELSFTKNKDTITISPKNGKDIIILMNEINELKQSKIDRLYISYSDYNGDEELCMQFTEHQIKYIIKFGEELMIRNKHRKEKLENYTLDSGL